MPAALRISLTLSTVGCLLQLQVGCVGRTGFEVPGATSGSGDRGSSTAGDRVGGDAAMFADGSGDPGGGGDDPGDSGDADHGDSGGGDTGVAGDPVLVGDPANCWGGLTPTSWYPLGASELVPRDQTLQTIFTPGGVSGTGTASTPVMAFDNDGKPVVAWIDSAPGSDAIYVRRWNGADWVEMSGSATGHGISGSSFLGVMYPAIAVAPNDDVLVVFNGNVGNGWHIFLARYDGLGWSEDAGSLTGDGVTTGFSYGFHGDVAVLSDSRPLVSWGTSRAYVRILNQAGDAWVALGASATSGQGVSTHTDTSGEITLAVDSQDRIVATWQQRISGTHHALYASRWNGGVWEPLGVSDSGEGINQVPTGTVSWPAVSIAPDDNPVVIWVGAIPTVPDTRFVYVRKFDGNSTWQELDGSGSSPGLGPTELVFNDIDASERPTIAWADYETADAEIKVLRFDGTSWQELGGSARCNGISNSLTGSGNATIAVDGRTCVAWSEGSTGGPKDIVLRCYDW